MVSNRLSKILIRPPFSATNTRPSGEKRTDVGSVSPLKTISSWKPGGNDAPDAGWDAVHTANDEMSIPTMMSTTAPRQSSG